MVTRREANGLINMGLCFLGVTAKNLGKTDNSVASAKSIQSQCALTFAMPWPTRLVTISFCPSSSSQSMFGSQGQRTSKSRFG